jgi:hypothetical protein
MYRAVHEVYLFKDENNNNDDIPSVKELKEPHLAMTVVSDPDDYGAHCGVDDDKYPPLCYPRRKNNINAGKKR